MTIRIITHKCERCDTVVAGNVLERHREMKCPGLDCERVLRFSGLPESDREEILQNIETYRMD
jgi:hypothetical protein